MAQGDEIIIKATNGTFRAPVKEVVVENNAEGASVDVGTIDGVINHGTEYVFETDGPLLQTDG